MSASTSSRQPSQIIRQHLFLPQPIVGESSTDPNSDDTGVTDLYHSTPMLKQLIPTRKNNHISGNQNHTTEKREYIDIPFTKSMMNLHSHEAKCAKYNDYKLPTKNNIIKHYQNQSVCSCQSSTDDNKQDNESNNRS
jgi:hypothetical protein